MNAQFLENKDSHSHSLNTLNMLYEYDDFMESIGTLIDLGCGSGLDLEWWATRTTRDDSRTPLNIKCLGVDLNPTLPMAHRYPNIQYLNQDFELPISMHKHTYDVAWSHNSFQYVTDPLGTLAKWWDIISTDGMLVIIVPQTTNIEFNTQAYDQRDFCYYNWTLVSLIHALAVSGFDCKNGFYLKSMIDPWLHVVVYKNEHRPLNPKTTSWYDLSELNLLPESANDSIQKHGFLRQRDLILPWLDKSLMTFQNH